MGSRRVVGSYNDPNDRNIEVISDQNVYKVHLDVHIESLCLEGGIREWSATASCWAPTVPLLASAWEMFSIFKLASALLCTACNSLALGTTSVLGPTHYIGGPCDRKFSTYNRFYCSGDERDAQAKCNGHDHEYVYPSRLTADTTNLKTQLFDTTVLVSERSHRPRPCTSSFETLR